ncbi:prephenate dehydrogenase/arogenate dehydrogenase family protein, partial [Candidatus Gottesmanbacteria bacterium]|nr:prephenate dehydrogenase/arogenate dehydrogenase family protein [Candidatus Gottesmanbacteria bacterium]
MDNLPKKITIIGVGLIGGSIALGLKMHLASKITIVGLCNDPKRAKLAQEKGLIDQAIFDLKNIPKTTGLVIIATPISSNLSILPQLSKIVARNCLIVDVGSTKEMVIKSVESKFPNLHFIGTHPMAGNDLTGFENAD